ncbi:TPA: hypothetical protein RGI49_000832 [Legionella pneumophila]|uniref:DUF5681 domain-containing protein n=1 Tax=Legionella pneumophila TaxID=446 RepID=A0AAP3MBV6_LEGPN|nr:DUF5681 domain-containing protein [Legionella pneumophila]HAT9433967.1 hypothetical protein [Legionella pneumophila subsp. pneumophila]MCZ4689968.1 DUF5681 domain-containing protein [Legionella pneumophila]MCZ4709162.1 DUF5681 domain-containing protein [Legionella pneumophila]MCZ4717902.1 DUF5681 domain-containing protein [Legionella pneumophila]MDW9025688.1 DUF5681 domain-containing protein [Legionella pneumophila]
MTKFKKGQSGNPSGKKTGTLNKRTRLAKLLEPHAEGLINKTVELALDGDVNALRLCIERLIPKATSQQIQMDLKGVDTENFDSLSVIGKNVIAAISTGDMTPDDGRQLMGILDSQRKLIEHTDIIRKLEELEDHMPKL